MRRHFLQRMPKMHNSCSVEFNITCIERLKMASSLSRPVVTSATSAARSARRIFRRQSFFPTSKCLYVAGSLDAWVSGSRVGATHSAVSSAAGLVCGKAALTRPLRQFFAATHTPCRIIVCPYSHALTMTVFANIVRPAWHSIITRLFASWHRELNGKRLDTIAVTHSKHSL